MSHTSKRAPAPIKEIEFFIGPIGNQTVKQVFLRLKEAGLPIDTAKMTPAQGFEVVRGEYFKVVNGVRR